LSDWQKKEIYRDVRFFHGAIQLMFIVHSADDTNINSGVSSKRWRHCKNLGTFCRRY